MINLQNWNKNGVFVDVN